MNNRILVINPGSTSTKVALFEGENVFCEQTLRHPSEELLQFSSEKEQLDFRREKVLNFLKEEEITLSSLDIVMARGGLCKPIPSGVYSIDENLLHDLAETPRKHASNLGAKIAFDIASKLAIPSCIADPVVVDELSDISRFSGHPKFPRLSIFHALNQKAIGRVFAKQVGIKYEDLNLIIVHLGGGISVGAHQKGKVIDVNQGLDGSGPFSPERSGTLPVGDIIRASFSGAYTQQQMIEMVVGRGGLYAYLGTNDAKAIREAAERGEEKELEIMNAMIYQVAKEICSLTVSLENNINAILLTGGLAHGKWITDRITEKVKHISDVHVFPGEDEMWALAQNGLMVLNKEAIPQVYGDTIY
ncbi:butyrate kinase [Flammeovirga kamogawensis]|uniref:Probable butyrate kinase n=1 Tax=Flammeovirga kamogawensis TaxID=373891 RepID=A0ABX8GTM2_9BACT|nr:butyrate kinase [Flammeovirga kamogawensis]MBB6462510.1 butyrate kinase [Flammeovirga kamogawensis]QWG06753.1 butyrate kinase [Flammeovirga kamogawensis]TRX68576.1 butyrate kinase [Flammeovirga kamogawensis]